MNTLLKQISEIVPTLDGWCSVKKAHTLASIIVAIRPENVVEIGVWGGRSLIPMAMACKWLNHGTVTGIDPWSAGESVKGQTPDNANWWGKVVNHDAMYAKCIESVTKAGVMSRTNIVRTTSDDYPASVTQCQLLHIDGNHGEQAYKDTLKFAPTVSIGGFIFMDDIGWSEGHVARGCQWIMDHGFKKLYNLDDGAVFQRVA